jgi:NAD(P)-dependent dehydrogenase (short-subunit alcohol dehydrogenase family)
MNRATRRTQGGGRILQLSSGGGQVAFPGGSLYHASKRGIEGFLDAVAQEVAVFGIGCTLVEPGGARTDFRTRSARVAPMLEAYNASPSQMVNRIIADTTRPPPGETMMTTRSSHLPGCHCTTTSSSASFS